MISLDIRDASGQPVYAVVWDHSGQEIADACGRNGDPFPSPGGSHIDVWLIAGHCYETTTPSIVTTGTVTATFARR
jgi:hypothetical protein